MGELDLDNIESLLKPEWQDVRDDECDAYQKAAPG